jgi:hypothetical protein
MPHGKYMRGTRLDHILAFAGVFILLAIFVIALDPRRTYMSVKDERRSDDVRHIMAAFLQGPIDNPEKYEALLKRTEGREGEKFMLGAGESCAGDWGARCLDAAVANDCLPPEEIFSDSSAVPVDPETDIYSEKASGYYLSFKGESLEIGACGAEETPIFLHTLIK